jgi:hypothetical protein
MICPVCGEHDLQLEEVVEEVRVYKGTKEEINENYSNGNYDDYNYGEPLLAIGYCLNCGTILDYDEFEMDFTGKELENFPKIKVLKDKHILAEEKSKQNIEQAYIHIREIAEEMQHDSDQLTREELVKIAYRRSAVALKLLSELIDVEKLDRGDVA